MAGEMMTPNDEQRTKVAQACRILGHEGVVSGITGHVSARSADGMIIRCRSEAEEGVRYTSADAVQWMSLDGELGSQGRDGGYQIPLEYPMHAEIYRHRADVGAVVHAHSEAVVLCTVAEVELKPIYGAFDPESLRLCLRGIPIFGSSRLIRTAESGREVCAVLGSQSAALLYGHGIVTVGPTVEAAAIAALKVDLLARVTWKACSSGRAIRDLSEEDIAFFADAQPGVNALGSGTSWLWRHQVRREREGLAPAPPYREAL